MAAEAEHGDDCILIDPSRKTCKLGAEPLLPTFSLNTDLVTHLFLIEKMSLLALRSKQYPSGLTCTCTLHRDGWCTDPSLTFLSTKLFLPLKPQDITGETYGLGELFPTFTPPGRTLLVLS